MERRKFLGDSVRTLGGIILGGYFCNEALADSYWTIKARDGKTQIDNLLITYNNPRGGSNEFNVYYGVNEKGRTTLKNVEPNVGLGGKKDDFRVRARGDGMVLVFNSQTPHGKFNVQDDDTNVVLNLKSNHQIKIEPATHNYVDLGFPCITLEEDAHAEIYSGKCYFSIKGKAIRAGERLDAPMKSTRLSIYPLSAEHFYEFYPNGQLTRTRKS